jgi:hypothetical protein
MGGLGLGHCTWCSGSSVVSGALLRGLQGMSASWQGVLSAGQWSPCKRIHAQCGSVALWGELAFAPGMRLCVARLAECGVLVGCWWCAGAESLAELQLVSCREMAAVACCQPGSGLRLVSMLMPLLCAATGAYLFALCTLQ